MEVQNDIHTGRMLDQAEMCRRIYWMTPFSATQAIASGRLRLTPVKIGRRNYYDPADVDRLVAAYETLYGGCTVAHRNELDAEVRRMEGMTQDGALSHIKDGRVSYLLAEAALGKKWTEKYLGKID